MDLLTTDPEVLEALYRARDRFAVLETGDDGYVYVDWTRCTCGHIYSVTVANGALPVTEWDAVAGGPSVDRARYNDWVVAVNTPAEGSLYARVLRAVALANGERLAPDFTDDLLASVVSSTTSDVDEELGEGTLEAARTLVQNTITAIERQQQEHREAVLAGG